MHRCKHEVLRNDAIHRIETKRDIVQNPFLYCREAKDLFNDTGDALVEKLCTSLLCCRWKRIIFKFYSQIFALEY